MSITHPQLVSALVKKPLDIFNTLTMQSLDAWHAATGIAGECGELLEMVSAEYDHSNFIEELGDIEFYMEQLRQCLCIFRAGSADDVAAEFVFDVGKTVPDLMLEQAVSGAIYGSQILDRIKKMAIYNKPVDVNPLTDELMRLDICMGIMRRLADVQRQEVLEANIAKLSVRYAGLQYSDKAAHERADKLTERKFFGQQVDG